MKDRKIELRHIVLIMLFALLTTLVMSTANLYSNGSPLEGWQNTIGAYLIAAVLEGCIFVAILAGSRAAGWICAIAMFFIGIFFNDRWDEFLIDFTGPNWHVTHWVDHKIFLSTTLFQFLATALSCGLSEKYIELTEKKNKGIIVDISENKQELALLKHSVSILKEQEAHLEQSRNNLIREECIKQTLIEDLQVEIKSLRAQKGKLNGHTSLAD